MCWWRLKAQVEVLYKQQEMLKRHLEIAAELDRQRKRLWKWQRELGRAPTPPRPAAGRTRRTAQASPSSARQRGGALLRALVL